MKVSTKNVSYCCVNPEKQAFREIIELNPIVQDTSIRSGQLKVRKMIHNAGTMSTKLAGQVLRDNEDEKSHRVKY